MINPSILINQRGPGLPAPKEFFTVGYTQVFLISGTVKSTTMAVQIGFTITIDGTPVGECTIFANDTQHKTLVSTPVIARLPPGKHTITLTAFDSNTITDKDSRFEVLLLDLKWGYIPSILISTMGPFPLGQLTVPFKTKESHQIFLISGSAYTDASNQEIGLKASIRKEKDLAVLPQYNRNVALFSNTQSRHRALVSQAVTTQLPPDSYRMTLEVIEGTRFDSHDRCYVLMFDLRTQLPAQVFNGVGNSFSPPAFTVQGHTQLLRIACSAQCNGGPGPIGVNVMIDDKVVETRTIYADTGTEHLAFAELWSIQHLSPGGDHTLKIVAAENTPTVIDGNDYLNVLIVDLD